MENVSDQLRRRLREKLNQKNFKIHNYLIKKKEKFLDKSMMIKNY